MEDDGRAFDPAVRSGGFGLAGMRERAAIVHGALELESVSGQGTTVYLRVPAGKAPAAAGCNPAPVTEQGIDVLRPWV